MANRANTLLCYSPSGGGKTSQILNMAKYVYETTGKKTRLISASGGGWEPIAREGLIELGIVEAFDIRARKNALADIRRLGEGYWPRIVKENGRAVRKFSFDDICKVTAAEWKTIGLVAVECLQSISATLIGHIADMDSAVKVGYERTVYDEAEYTFGSTDRGHVGLVQRELHRLVTRGFGSLPVDYVMFTSLVGKGEDKRTGDTFYGPDSIGTAITHIIPSWVGDCFHLDTLQTEEGEQMFVAWFVKHPDPITGAMYHAKVRVSPREIAGLMKAYPNGYVPLSIDEGLAGFYRFLARLESGTLESSKAWKAQVDKQRSTTKGEK